MWVSKTGSVPFSKGSKTGIFVSFLRDLKLLPLQLFPTSFSSLPSFPLFGCWGWKREPGASWMTDVLLPHPYCLYVKDKELKSSWTCDIWCMDDWLIVFVVYTFIWNSSLVSMVITFSDRGVRCLITHFLWDVFSVFNLDVISYAAVSVMRKPKCLKCARCCRAPWSNMKVFMKWCGEFENWLSVPGWAWFLDFFCHMISVLLAKLWQWLCSSDPLTPKPLNLNLPKLCGPLDTLMVPTESLWWIERVIVITFGLIFVIEN